MKKKYTVLVVGLIVMFFLQTLTAQTVFRGKILDETTQSPITEAKIGISDQGVGVVTNENGLFNYRKYHQTIGNASRLRISAPGYKMIELRGDNIRGLFNKSSKIYLTKSDDIPTTPSFIEQKNVTIFWDASLSSERRDFKKEWGFIEAYFEELGEVNVTFVVFNETILSTKRYTITKDISLLKKEVEGLEYQGTTSYDILTTGNTDAVLLFSEGEAVLGQWQGDRDIPFYAVSSLSRANHEYLRSLAMFTSGSYINLSEASIAESINQIKKGIPFKDKTIAISSAYNGIVKTSIGPIQGASITIKGDLEEFLSKSDGSFTVPAEIGDVLQIRYLGMHPKEMLVEDLPSLVVEMKPIDELLKEVIIEGKKAKSKETSDAGFGEKSKDQIGVSVNTITSKDIRPNAQYLADIVRGRFAGVQVSGFGTEAVFTIRGGNSSQPAIWVVDGSIYEQPPSFIDPQNVASISILKSIQASARYGSIASGGAFIVKTNAFIRLGSDGEIVDTALITGNEYTEQVAQLNLEALKPNYVKQIQAIDGVEAQFAMYQNLAKANTTNAEFFIDMALYFQPLDKEKAKTIRSRLVEVAQKNSKVLRVAAYLYESAGEYDNALKLYERITSIAPSEAQSYRDLAKAYEEAGFYDKSLELYINMLGEQILGVDFSGLDKPLGHELLHLVSLHKNKINTERLPEDWILPNYRLDLRMVLEWSDREAPFEFQFVNPEDKFFKWNHTLFDNKERLEAEVKSGFQTEEFVIDEAPHGLWRVNIEYLGEETFTTIPPYLKYTIYRDYGTPSERKDVKVIKLTSEIGKAQLDEFLL
ncbi:TonB-dependent receptor plug domain-containing protein [uncultured Dokdonia sp.]|uniref:TonB-dependent receptor plug domain-containing protein n=1 Tax=uncultured Dokdonia sp. TaxID=575653 RepID=UPI0026255AF7|nr:TonB-dependent receptor plug domain-containing protein [uncultured Dokdonia sp.]